MRNHFKTGRGIYRRGDRFLHCVGGGQEEIFFFSRKYSAPQIKVKYESQDTLSKS